MAKRRGNNEGTIYRKPSGKWQAQITLAGKRVGKTFATKQECQDWLRDVQTQKTGGLLPKIAISTLREYLDLWLLQIKPNLREKTWRQYQGICKQHVYPRIGSSKILEISPTLIQTLYGDMLSRGTGKRTIQLTHQILHKAFQDGLRLGMLASNPISSVAQPKTSHSEMKFYTAEEARAFLQAVQGHRIEALFQLAITTGMRQGELLGLKWEDIDWASSTIHVSRQLIRVPGTGLELTHPKTKRSVRTVQLGPMSLRTLMAHRGAMKWEFGVEPELDTLIFRSTTGNPLGPKRVWEEFKSILNSAKLKDIRFHDLRHTAASLMLSTGMAPIKVSQQLGHSKPSTTMDIYGHLIPGLDMDSSSRIEQLISPIATELQLTTDSAETISTLNPENTSFPL